MRRGEGYEETNVEERGRWKDKQGGGGRAKYEEVMWGERVLYLWKRKNKFEMFLTVWVIYDEREERSIVPV